MITENLNATNSSAVFQDGTMLPLFVNEIGQLVVQRGSLWLDHTKIPGFVRIHIDKLKPQTVAAIPEKTEPEEVKTPEKSTEDTARAADLVSNPNYLFDREAQQRVSIKIEKMKKDALV